MKASVIICTLDTKQILPETIPSIKRSPLVEQLILVQDEYRPIGFARDIGWRKARNSLVCFIDDDAIVSQGWIERLVKEFGEPKVGAVWSTVKPLNPNRINTLECILQNHTLKKISPKRTFRKEKSLGRCRWLRAHYRRRDSLRRNQNESTRLGNKNR